jgi:hypothetical protein
MKASWIRKYRIEESVRLEWGQVEWITFAIKPLAPESSDCCRVSQELVHDPFPPAWKSRVESRGGENCGTSVRATIYLTHHNSFPQSA